MQGELTSPLRMRIKDILTTIFLAGWTIFSLAFDSRERLSIATPKSTEANSDSLQATTLADHDTVRELIFEGGYTYISDRGSG
jgi:hypothetical protein